MSGANVEKKKKMSIFKKISNSRDRLVSQSPEKVRGYLGLICFSIRSFMSCISSC